MPYLVLLAAVVVVIFALLQRYTSFGRIVIAIGSNETAVRLAGISVKKQKMAVYAISGLCAALSGIIAASRTAIGTPIIGEGLELDAIAACVIGGASLAGRGGLLHQDGRRRARARFDQQYHEPALGSVLSAGCDQRPDHHWLRAAAIVYGGPERTERLRKTEREGTRGKGAKK